MKATCVYRTKATVTVKGGKRIAVVMDLYKLPAAAQGYPEGYKFSWIAFDPDEPSNRVLFDVHPPKGPHFHIDEDPIGTPYQWKNLINGRTCPRQRNFLRARSKNALANSPRRMNENVHFSI